MQIFASFILFLRLLFLFEVKDLSLDVQPDFPAEEEAPLEKRARDGGAALLGKLWCWEARCFST